MSETIVKNEETRAFDAEVGKVLQLVIHSLYTNKEIFLRELISNASDALDKLRYQSLTDDSLVKKDPDLKIGIYADPEAKTLTIADNGIGMTREEMVENLGTIARSGTLNFIKSLSENKENNPQLIGQFGVGFYSAFMVAKKVKVISRKAGTNEANAWESDGESSYTIREAKKSELEKLKAQGTVITLELRGEEKEFADKHRISHIVHTYSDHIAQPIEFIEKDETSVLNTASALWLKPKAEITEKQYEEFYHHVAHSGDKPWMILHNKAEGAVSYTNLLFIPSMKPFDLFHPDRKTRVKLYVRRVFITEENLKIIPQYLRFLRGVVDSEDLPLNISRETLQDNAILQKIKKAITRKVISELKKKSETATGEYNKFWENFGPVLKEGLCEGMEDRENLLEICRFHSTKDQAKLTSIDEYISRMKEGQEEIYYLIGDDTETLGSNPLLEGFKKKDIEVLLLSDHVDDFWTSVIFEHKGKQLKSITKSGIDLGKVKNAKGGDKESSGEANDSGIKNFIDFAKKTLAAKVKDVRATGKLSESPVCISAEEGGIDIRMEKFLAEQGQIPGRQAKVLEVNPEHPLITSLSKKLEKGESGELKDAVLTLYDQALVIQGEPISDAAGFAKRVNELLKKSFT